MKKPKKFFISLMCFFILSCVTIQGNSKAYKTEQVTPSCESCVATEKPKVIDTNINENGNEIELYEDGVEVETIDDETFIVRDYSHVLNDTIPEQSTYGAWLEIGKTILKYTIKGLDACQAIQYMAHHDLCRIVIKYVANVFQKPGKYEYKVTGRYISGHVPNCEPSHSQQCNSGYWEYKVVKVK